MKNVLIILAMTLPFCAVSQQFTPLRDQLPPASNLLQVGDNIVLIHPLDAKNQIHKWVSFDSSLKMVSVKKLVSPDWQKMLSQSYLAINDAVIRVDQLIFEDALYLSLFCFDAFGNLKQKQELGQLPLNGNKLEPLPFYVSFSADKKKVALVQPLSGKKDELTLSSIVLTNQLELIGSSQRTFSFDMLVMDMLPPLVDTDGSVFVPIVDKFDSYRLGTEIQLLPVSGENDPPQWRVDRKKLKDVRLKLKDGELSMNALYSLEESKADVAGVVYATLPLQSKSSRLNFYTYDDGIKRSLSKKIGTIGRKGNPLNYLYVLPSKQPQEERAFGVLLIEASTPGRIHNTPTVANASADLDKVRRQVAMVNSLVGTRRRSQTSPTPGMNYAEASTHAALMERNGSSAVETEAKTKDNALPEPKKDNARQLLYFSHRDSAVNYQFLKFRIPTEPFYEFFTYAELNGKYHAIHYQLPSLTRPQLVSTTVNEDGKMIQKVLLENKHKLLIEGYPSLVYKGRKLIAVYEDRYKNEMGIVGVNF